MNTQIENDIHFLIEKVTKAEGTQRLELLNRVAALVDTAEQPKTILLRNLTADQEASIRTLQDAMKSPEVRQNGVALANVARTIRRLRLGFL